MARKYSLSLWNEAERYWHFALEGTKQECEERALYYPNDKTRVKPVTTFNGKV